MRSGQTSVPLPSFNSFLCFRWGVRVLLGPASGRLKDTAGGVIIVVVVEEGKGMGSECREDAEIYIQEVGSFRATLVIKLGTRGGSLVRPTEGV